ncbi:MAG: CpXC domain-containing protein [Anaerolineales bacterium]
MPARKTQTFCPNCRQPVMVEFEQVFDTNQNPDAKNLLLSGQANLLQCQFCKYQGPYSTPLVYHDPAKDLLLTFVPPELGLTRDMQEKVIGPLITQVVNALPQEKRKAYLLQPKTMLTYQTLIETILAADGITKEMLQGQQQRMSLIQRLVNTTSEEALKEIARQEDKWIDREFFALYSQLLANAAANGNERLARRMMEVQQTLAEVSTYGKQVMEQQKEVELAVTSLRELGEKLTREKLLDLIIAAPNETRVQAYVSLARGGMDYQFFQLLSERIERARGPEHARLASLREQLLALTRSLDERREAQIAQIRQFINAVIESGNIQETIAQNAAAIDELFIHVLEMELESARKTGDLKRSAKLQEMVQGIEQLSAPAGEMQILNELIEMDDANERQKLLEELPKEAVSALAEMLAGVMGQVEASGDAALTERVQNVYKQVLKYSMRVNLRN